MPVRAGTKPSTLLGNTERGQIIDTTIPIATAVHTTTSSIVAIIAAGPVPENRWLLDRSVVVLGSGSMYMAYPGHKIGNPGTR